MEKKKTSIFKKWWFWLCVTLIVCVINSIIMFNANNSINSFTVKIQSIYPNSKIYISNKNALILELKDFNIASKEFANITNVIKQEINNKLKNYTELKILYYINKGKEETLIIETYNLQNQKLEESMKYINFND